MPRESIFYKINQPHQIHHGKVELFINYSKPGTAYEQLEAELKRIVEEEVQRRLDATHQLASNHC